MNQKTNSLQPVTHRNQGFLRYLGIPLILLLLSFNATKTYALTAGDIAIIAVNADAVKTMSFVALVDIPVNTTISFTDNAWTTATGPIATTEGAFPWTATTAVSAGTVVKFILDTEWTVSTGSVTKNSNFNLSVSGDQILAYEGTTAPTSASSSSWLFAFSLENFITTGTTSSNTSYLPSALSGASVAMTTSSTETDNAYFANGSTTQTAVTVSGTKAELLALFTDASKYYKNDTGPLTLPTYTITVNTGSVSAPTTQASSITFSSISQTGISVSWTNGDGAKRVVIMNTSNSFTAPADGTDPSANATYVGSGEQVVYNGSGNSLDVTGLTAGTTYWFRVYEYNGSGTGTLYLTSTATNNPNSQATTAVTPTITVSETTLSGFTYEVDNGPSPEKTFTVSGSYLTADISIDAPANYEISTTSEASFVAADPISLTQSSGSVAETTIYVRLKAGLSTGIYNGETISITSTGADTKTLTLNGSVTGVPAKIFISEYIEGSSNNKAVEIYNGESTSIDLSKLRVLLYANGAATPSTTNIFSPTEGTLASGASIVVYNSGAVDGIKANGDYSSTVTYFNGDDALAVEYDGVITDVFGAIGTDPGTAWPVAGTTGATLDKTLLRKLSVTQGNITNLGSFGTTAENSEWVVKPTDYFSNLGEFGTAFTGTTDTDWSVADNWDMGIPVSTHAAIIPATTNIAVLGGAAQVTNLLIKAGGKLTVGTTGSLSAVNVKIKSDANGTGTFVDNGATTVTGTATVEQNLSAARNWYMSSPVTATGLPTASTGSLTIYTYPENHANQQADDPSEQKLWKAGNYWETVTLGTFTTGKGYVVLPSVANKVSFTGALNTGAKEIGLTYTATNPKKGFNLVGNPYPSFLDATILLSENSTKVEGNIWYRTHTGSAYIFNTYNGPGTVSVPQAPNPTYIPPMQSFWVRALADAVTLNFTNAMRMHNGTANPILLRAPAVTDRQLVRLNVSNGTVSDEMVIYSDENATAGLDAYDASKMMNGSNSSPAINLYTTVGSENLVIDGRNTLPLDVVIPVQFTANAFASGLYNITANEITNLPAGVKVELVEGAEKTVLSDASHPFSVNAGESRTFGLILRSPGAITGFDNGNTENIIIFAANNGQIVVRGSEAGSIIRVYNATGQRIAAKTAVNSNTTIDVPAAGVYMVRVGDVTRKIVAK